MTGIYANSASIQALDCRITNPDTAVYSDVYGSIACFNCIVSGSVFVYFSGDVKFTNCTIQGSVGGYVDSLIYMRNCIQHPILEHPVRLVWRRQHLSGSEICHRTTNTNAFPDDGIVDMGYHYPSTPPAPTQTPVNGGVDLIMNDSEFHAGDPFKLRAMCSGPTDENLDLYAILDVGGTYWFYPEWTRTPSCRPIMLLDGQMHYFFLLDFVWPEGAGQSDDVRFWGALLRPGTSELLGTYDCISFSYR